MQITKEWLEFLREQYPIGSRIKLLEMKDPYHPVEPGTEGELTSIDDAGQLHIRWDNGRTLALIPTEDLFTVQPPKPALLKLYMPMSVDRYERNQWGDWEDCPMELDASEAVKYADSILAAIQRERLPEEAERGMMRYYDGDDAVNRKVQSYTFTAEVRDRKLWGVAVCEVLGTLEPGELEKLKETISGQASDGFGEGFEQRAIQAPDGEIYAHLWSSDDSWSIQTEQELFGPRLDRYEEQKGGIALG